jgi:hypothetical protein
VAELDDERFETREQATRKLEGLADMAEPALLACLAGAPTLEQRLRIERVLAQLSGPITDADKLRALRCVEVFEGIATPEAVELLQALTVGADGAYETLEARAALKRRKP